MRTLLSILLLCSVLVTAQEEAKAPALSDLQKKDLQIAAQNVELWQLRAQAATVEYEKARETLQRIIAALTPAGYQINEKLELVKLPPKAEAPK